MNRTNKIAGYIFNALLGLVIAWLIISFFDIVAHNMDGANYGKYLEWNFLMVLENLIRG